MKAIREMWGKIRKNAINERKVFFSILNVEKVIYIPIHSLAITFEIFGRRKGSWI